MKNILFVVSILFLVLSCKKDKENLSQSITENNAVIVTDTTLIDGVLLELINNNGKAELRINSKVSGSGNIKISPPCYFLRWTGNKVENFSYPDAGVDHTLVILGNIDKRPGRICGKGLQGLLFKKGSIVITPKTLANSFTCADSGADEKIFWGFAHD
ncbi:hypothetical protein ACQWU4_19145 [Chryseobacterium sp. MIQD13]|uniref:hypothetical protein n=1 Tax=Chryseobacterium sp. MIQD13 TaxID=3422310 RepID=UPI003D29A32E